MGGRRRGPRPAGPVAELGRPPRPRRLVLLVDLQKPLTPAEKPAAHGPTLTVSLEPAHPGNILGRDLPFPDFAALGRGSARGRWPSASTNRPTGSKFGRRPPRRRRRTTAPGERKFPHISIPIGSKPRTRAGPRRLLDPASQAAAGPRNVPAKSCYRPAGRPWKPACCWRPSRAARSRSTSTCRPRLRPRPATRGLGRAASRCVGAATARRGVGGRARCPGRGRRPRRRRPPGRAAARRNVAADVRPSAGRSRAGAIVPA